MSISSKVKALWKSSHPFTSLKSYLREALADATGEMATAEDKELIEQWIKNKHGWHEKIAKDARFKNKGPKLAAMRQASKAKKSSS
jgi:hypothetical protein